MLEVDVQYHCLACGKRFVLKYPKIYKENDDEEWWHCSCHGIEFVSKKSDGSGNNHDIVQLKPHML